MKRLKDLETENARLRKAVSDLTLDQLTGDLHIELRWRDHSAQ